MLSVVAALFWLLEAAGPADAHHSASAEFDLTKKIKVTGALTKLDWANPHTIFHLEVQLMRAGWTRSSMKLGDVITVEGIHARDGSNHGMASAVIMASTGKQLFAGKAEEP
jgi:hypothetical protein